MQRAEGEIQTSDHHSEKTLFFLRRQTVNILKAVQGLNLKSVRLPDLTSFLICKNLTLTDILEIESYERSP